MAPSGQDDFQVPATVPHFHSYFPTSFMPKRWVPRGHLSSFWTWNETGTHSRRTFEVSEKKRSHRGPFEIWPVRSTVTVTITPNNHITVCGKKDLLGARKASVIIPNTHILSHTLTGVHVCTHIPPPHTHIYASSSAPLPCPAQGHLLPRGCRSHLLK